MAFPVLSHIGASCACRYRHTAPDNSARTADLAQTRVITPARRNQPRAISVAKPNRQQAQRPLICWNSVGKSWGGIVGCGSVCNTGVSSTLRMADGSGGETLQDVMRWRHEGMPSSRLWHSCTTQQILWGACGGRTSAKPWRPDLMASLLPFSRKGPISDPQRFPNFNSVVCSQAMQSI